MKRTYTLLQQYIAYVLLISLSLQSCGGFNNFVIPIQDEPTAPVQAAAQAIILQPNIDPLINQELTAQGGHVVTFYEQVGELKADVTVNASQGFSKTYESINVYVEQGVDVSRLASLAAQAQEHRIHFQLEQEGNPARVIIYKDAGLLGGSSKKEKGAKDKGEKDKKKQPKKSQHKKGDHKAGKPLPSVPGTTSMARTDEDKSKTKKKVKSKKNDKSSSSGEEHITQVGVNSSKLRLARSIQRSTNTTRNILTVKYNTTVGIIYVVILSNGMGNTKLDMPNGQADERKRGHTEGIFYALMSNQAILVPNDFGEGDKQLELPNKDIVYISSTNEPCSGEKSENCKVEIIKRLVDEDGDNLDIAIYYNNKYEVGGTAKTSHGFRTATNTFWNGTERSETESEEQAHFYVLEEIPEEAKDRTDPEDSILFKAMLFKDFIKQAKSTFHIGGRRSAKQSVPWGRKIYKNDYYKNKFKSLWNHLHDNDGDKT